MGTMGAGAGYAYSDAQETATLCRRACRIKGFSNAALASGYSTYRSRPAGLDLLSHVPVYAFFQLATVAALPFGVTSSLRCSVTNNV